MKKKIIQWYNAKTKSIMYGIQVLHNGEWFSAMEDNKPLFFNTKKEANVKLKTI
jgi:hypothetical protein